VSPLRSSVEPSPTSSSDRPADLPAVIRQATTATSSTRSRRGREACRGARRGPDAAGDGHPARARRRALEQADRAAVLAVRADDQVHLTNIYRKLEVGSRTEAVRYAYDHGLVENRCSGRRPRRRSRGDRAPERSSPAGGSAALPARLPRPQEEAKLVPFLALVGRAGVRHRQRRSSSASARQPTPRGARQGRPRAPASRSRRLIPTPRPFSSTRRAHTGERSHPLPTIGWSTASSEIGGARPRESNLFG